MGSRFFGILSLVEAAKIATKWMACAVFCRVFREAATAHSAEISYHLRLIIDILYTCSKRVGCGPGCTVPAKGPAKTCWLRQKPIAAHSGKARRRMVEDNGADLSAGPDDPGGGP